MEAGLELFGTLGYASTSVRAVSAAAALNSRYFYESFGSRESSAVAVPTIDARSVSPPMAAARS